MKVILLKPVSNLGLAGSVVNVSDGYAANYLIPKKIASTVTTTLIKVDNKENQKLDQQEIKTLSAINNLKIMIRAKANDNGKLYEVVKAGQLASLLRQKKKINIKSSQIKFIKPIKEIGDHSVDVKIGSQFTNFKLTVEKL